MPSPKSRQNAAVTTSRTRFPKYRLSFMATKCAHVSEIGPNPSEDLSRNQRVRFSVGMGVRLRYPKRALRTVVAESFDQLDHGHLVCRQYFLDLLVLRDEGIAVVDFAQLRQDCHEQLCPVRPRANGQCRQRMFGGFESWQSVFIQ